MKKFILFAHVCTWWILAFPGAVVAQDALSDYPNYVVIGAFAIHPNAILFSDDANKHQFPAKFEINPHRNLYYVYVLATGDREEAFAEALKLRTDTKYFDTWVYSGPLGAIENGAPTPGPGLDFNPATGRQIGSTDQARNTTATTTGQANESPRKTGQPGKSITDGLSAEQQRTVAQDTQAARDPENGQSAENVARDGARNSVADNRDTLSSDDEPGSEKSNTSQKPAPVKVSTQPLTTDDVVGKDFYFHLFRADNRKMVEGEVDAIDFEKSRKMASYPGNSAVKVTMPSGVTKQISFVCQVFGYRKQQVEFNSATPSQEFYLDENGNLVVPFELMRLQKGDIAIMYNVFFFKDAAVMRPESRYEVNNLLDLLVENPDYRIRIHGHTNGNASGKIIRMDASENFYSLSGTKQGFGSAKQLSEDRAIVIRNFLISSGIAADRMEVKAWGGKQPIHDKHSVRANENVRVEVEILSD